MPTMRWTWICAVAMLAAGCARSTEIVNTWKDPGAASVRFKRVLAVCLCRDDGIRRTVEDKLAKQIRGATPAYTVLSEAELQDRDQAKRRVQSGGFDGAVVMRLGSVDRETTYVPGQVYSVPSAYGSMWGYWGYGWSTAYQPGYVEQDVVVNVETNIYSVTEDKLVWASRSRTYDPKSVNQVVDEVVNATVSEMKRQKVLAD